MSKTIPQLDPVTSLNLTDQIEVAQLSSPTSLSATLLQLINNIVNPNARLTEAQITNLVSDLANLQSQITFNAITPLAISSNTTLNSSRITTYVFIAGSSLVQVSLPTAPLLGNTQSYKFINLNSAGFQILQSNSGEVVNYLSESTTPGPYNSGANTGYIQCADQYSSCDLFVANPIARQWQLANTTGTFKLY